MSESVTDAPVPDDDVEETQAGEQDQQHAARSLPEAGTDDDPGTQINY